MDSIHDPIGCKIRELETQMELMTNRINELEKRNNDWIWYLRDRMNDNVDCTRDSIGYNLGCALQILFIRYVTSYQIGSKEFKKPERIIEIISFLYKYIANEKNENIIKLIFEIIRPIPYNWGVFFSEQSDEYIIKILRKIYEITKYTKYDIQKISQEHPDIIDLKYYRRCIKELFGIDE